MDARHYIQILQICHLYLDLGAKLFLYFAETWLESATSWPIFFHPIAGRWTEWTSPPLTAAREQHDWDPAPDCSVLHQGCSGTVGKCSRIQRPVAWGKRVFSVSTALQTGPKGAVQGGGVGLWDGLLAWCRKVVHDEEQVLLLVCALLCRRFPSMKHSWAIWYQP